MGKATDDEVRAQFAELVNMSPRDIADWHKTDQSKSVGQDSGDGVSVGVKARPAHDPALARQARPQRR
jgi:hypothetical protein